MGAACRGGGAMAGVFSGVEPIGRRGAGCAFGVLGRDWVVVLVKMRKLVETPQRAKNGRGEMGVSFPL